LEECEGLVMPRVTNNDRLGLSAAHTALERGAFVTLIDKSSFLGGNSTKATSGINGALTQTQVDQKVAKLLCADSRKLGLVYRCKIQ
jgi:succinate dehydrogenase/fumarate reductase flavoprotein subunit